MGYEPRLIAPFEGGGLITYYKPWLIGNEAFPNLQDAYCWRGVVRKREGFSLLATIATTPIQGLRTYFTKTGNEQLLAFSTTKAYLLISTPSIQFSDISTFQTSGAAISWTGGVNDFFQSTNYALSLWVTNNVDPLRFWNGSTVNGWNDQQPLLFGTTRLTTTKLIIAYKGRLVALSPTEGGVAFTNRARWSQIGNPYVSATGADPAVVPPAPFTTAGNDNAWRSDIPGKGGFIDADTNEQIISWAIIRDVLIVFFQRSTWRLRYTGNEVLPFLWERLNTQYGSESSSSTITFDDGALTFSRYGFIKSDTNAVARIDEKIPDQSFFQMKFGTSLATLSRVQGVRDYYRQTAYWCYEDVEDETGSNNQVLAYNYLDKTWAIFNQPFRCFGYYKQFFDLQWQNATFTWESANFPWAGDEQSQFPQVVAGDVTNGNVYITYETTNDSQDFGGTDNVANFGFTIATKRINPYIDKGLRCRLAYVDIYASTRAGSEITVQLFTDDNDSTPTITKVATMYRKGQIQISSVTPGNPTTITAVMDHGLVTGQETEVDGVIGTVGDAINGISFPITSTSSTTFTIPVNTNGFTYTSGGYFYGTVLASGDAKYTRVFFGAIARMHQIVITLSPDQISDTVQGQAQFEMQGLVIWTRPEGRIKQ